MIKDKSEMPDRQDEPEVVKDDEKVLDSAGAKNDTEEKDELDERFNTFGKILKKSLSGDVLAKDAIKSQTGVILIVAFFIMLCTSNRYSCQQDHIEEAELKKELSDSKNRAFSSFSVLTEKSRRSKLLEGLKTMNDSTLQITEQPPYIVQIPQEKTDE